MTQDSAEETMSLPGLASPRGMSGRSLSFIRPSQCGRCGTMLDRFKAQMLLSECNGRDIWPVDLCTRKGIPETWIDELADCYESGFDSALQTIHLDDRVTNQFHGVQDLDLARKLGEYLGIDTQRVTALTLGRTAAVRAIQEAVEES